MSWWVGMYADLGGPELVDIVESINMTYNVHPMLCEALDTKMFRDLLDGMSGKESIPILKKGIADMEKYPEKYEAMNPSNGWGDAESTLQFLRELLEMAEKAPRAEFYVH